MIKSPPVAGRDKFGSRLKAFIILLYSKDLSPVWNARASGDTPARPRITFV